MNEGKRKRVALLGKVPPDIQRALEKEFDLTGAEAIHEMDEADRQAVTHGLTSAISGVEPDALEDLANLKAIASVGAGVERFDLGWLATLGVTLYPTPHVMTEDAAESAVALVFALLRNIVSNDLFVRSGKWAGARAPFGSRISERKVGIVGLGRIGGSVADKLGALGCAISYTGRSQKDVPWPFVPDIGALAQSVDVLVLTCAGGEKTRGLIESDVLRQLGSQGFLVNVSRGSVVDETALIAALEQGTIAGAALDVFENEPSPDPRFIALPNCILSPHAAVFTHENRRDLIGELRRLLGAGA